MSLLTPLFLLGLLGIALPIWLHRLQTQTTEREKFSSTMFMEASKKRIHVQRKLKYLILMALRILFFILLALAFTRPSFLLPPQPTVSADSTHHIIVVDSSFSMQEGSSFSQALQLAETIISSLAGDDLASIYAASSRVTTIATASADQSSLSEALRGLNAGNGRLDIGSMVSALNGLIETSPANFILHIISDFQRTGQALRFADMIPNEINGRSVNLVLEQVKTVNSPNLSVDSVQVLERNKVRVGIRGYLPGADNKTLSLIINDVVQQEIPFQASITPTSNEFYLFEDVTFEGGDNKVSIQISPTDSLAEDDRRFSVFDNLPPAPVLLLSENLSSLGVTYITAALEAAPRGYQVEAVTLDQLDTRILQRYPWLVIEDLGAIDQTLAAAISQYINAGGSVLTALGERSQGLAKIPVSDHLLTLVNRFEKRSQSVVQKIVQIDTSHPALGRTIGWNNINITNTLPLVISDQDSILIEIEDGEPLLLEQSIGLGRLMLFTTSLDNHWTDLPVKPVFVTFMAEAAQYLSNENVLIKEQTVDSFLPLNQSGGASGQIYDPDGESLLTLADTTQEQDIMLTKVGYYQIFTPQGEVLVAVNADSRESDLTITDAQALQNWQMRVSGNSNVSSINAQNITIDETSVELEIWRTLLLLLAIIVMAESLLSNRYLRYNT